MVGGSPWPGRWLRSSAPARKFQVESLGVVAVKPVLPIVPPLALVLAIACTPFTGPQQELVVRASVNAPVVHADSGLTIRITAFNPWSHAITFTTCYGPLGYNLVAPSDSVVRAVGLACPLISSTYTIGAGDSLVHLYHIGSFSSWEQPASGHGAPILYRWPAGEYRLTGYLLTDDGNRASDPVTFQLVCSNPAWTRC